MNMNDEYPRPGWWKHGGDAGPIAIARVELWIPSSIDDRWRVAWRLSSSAQSGDA